MTSQRDALEGLLDICDQIRSLQERASRSPESKDERQVERMRDRVRGLRDEVYSAMPSLLGGRGSAKTLADAELLVLALLFHCRVTGREPALVGSQLVALLDQAGFPRSDSLGLFAGDRALLSQGWLRADHVGTGAHYPLDSRFHPSLEALDLFWPSETAGEEAVVRPADGPVRAFRSEEELLWELYRWRNLCMQRAGALFDNERPEAAPTPRYRTLRREARATLVRVRARLKATHDGTSFRVERFRREHALNFDEMLLVVHYLFGELVEGEPYLPALECLRMVAETRGDLFRKRRLVSRSGRLRREGILRAAGEEFDKALATDLSLADWVADDILAGMGRSLRLQEEDLDDLLREDSE